MDIMKRVPFEFEGKQYEILVTKHEDGYKVRAYIGNKPANPWVYSVDYETSMDFQYTIGEPAYEHLIKSAKSDVVNKRLETLLSHLKEKS